MQKNIQSYVIKDIIFKLCFNVFIKISCGIDENISYLKTTAI